MSIRGIIKEKMDDLEWMDEIEPTPPREDGDLRVGDIIYVGDERDPRYTMEIIDTGNIGIISYKYDMILDNTLSMGNETSCIVYELVRKNFPDDEEEADGDIELMGTNYARDLIVRRGYWKYMTKID